MLLMIRAVFIILSPYNNFLLIIVILLLPDYLCNFFIQNFPNKNLSAIQRHWIHFFPYLTVRTLSIGRTHIHQHLQTP